MKTSRWKSLQSQDEDIIEKAFAAVHDEFSAEYVLCHPVMGNQFIAKCRELGDLGTVFSVNMRLLNLRKQGKLRKHKTQRRKPRGDSSIHVPVQNAVRFLERQLNTTVDRILCDPASREQFDALVQIFLPGCDVLESRYAALTLRKKNALKPEVVGRVVESVGGSVTPIKDIKVSDLPEGPGVYLFFDRENTLYAGKADNLRRRIDDHLCTWTARDLISQVQKGRRSEVFLVLHVLKTDITTRTLFAYEAEIIRSRNPSHNKAGKSSS